eukprot:TRINITY_DN22948_c0_g1_i1.p1 TRINITY_DN22948_c0_g1~~TRINITY_DN22948_c0_g1_i1.p1  ORF type:complete len:395 (+),score=80.74 TRINITY_DN22948_c0_g1_i1:46-1230(+)
MVRDEREVFTRHRPSELLRVDIPARRQKGGVHPAWQMVAAQGPVPKAAKQKHYLKGVGSERPKGYNVTGCAVYVTDNEIEKKVTRGKKLSETPKVERGTRGVLSDEWLYADLESPRTGIRVNLPKPVDKSARAARILDARRAKQASYVVTTPYAKKGETEEYSYRRSRRAVTPSPGPSTPRDSIMGLSGVSPSPVRQRGKNFSCKPLDMGIFDKAPQSERRSKYIDPNRNTNTSSSMLFDRPERIFLPTNYREKGTMSSSREGAEGCLAKGAGRNRPPESLKAAWSIAEDAPEAGSTGRRRILSEAGGVPWGTQRRLSTSRYHRKQSFDASMKFLRKKAAVTSRAHPPVPGESAFSRSNTAGSLASFGSDTSLISPRGKRIWHQQSNNVILNWQ